MSRCSYPVWREHQRKALEKVHKSGKFIRLLNVLDSALGIDLDYVIKFFDQSSVELDANEHADIFKEDVFHYTERVTNSDRSVQEVYDEIRMKSYLENYVNENWKHVLWPKLVNACLLYVGRKSVCALEEHFWCQYIVKACVQWKNISFRRLWMQALSSWRTRL